jgi:hypothetical protein
MTRDVSTAENSALKKMELTSPIGGLLVSGRPPGRRRQVTTMVAGALLLAVVLVAVTGDHRRPRSEVLTEQGPPSSDGVLRVSAQDMKAAKAQVQADLSSLQTERAARVRGSIPTARAESDAIIGSSHEYVRGMDRPFYAFTGHHNDIQSEADAIIDFANR